jgi:hypothetical protein
MADDLDATRTALIDREALDQIIRSIELQFASAEREERAAQERLTDVLQEIAH